MCFTCSGGFERLICMYFTCPGGPGRVPPLTNLTGRVGPLPKNLRPEASEALRLAEARVLRVLEARGGSFACVLHVLEALGGSGRVICTCFTCPGGSGRLICTYFTCPGGIGRVQHLTNLRGRVGPLPKNLRPEASEVLRLAGWLAGWLAG